MEKCKVCKEEIVNCDFQNKDYDKACEGYLIRKAEKVGETQFEDKYQDNEI